MATVYEPIAKDSSINTTETPSRNIADVLAQGLAGIETAITGGADKVPKTDIATVETTNTASRAYSIGELVYVNGNLYKVITAIASGATFTVGTNIQSTNVSGRLNEPLQMIMLDPNDYPLLFGSGAIFYTEHCVTISLNGMKNLTAQTSNVLLTVPTDLKPKSNIVVQVTSTTLTELYRFILEASTGKLYVYPYQTVSGSGNIPVTITYTI